MSYNSKIILCKGIKMDRDYKDVINYTEEQMINLCLEHKVVDASDFNFVRENRGQLNVPYSIDICLQANYIAFQNPDYSGKWFFAWVDEVHFVAPGTTKIMFTIDYWSTWFYKFNVGQCFVEREHVEQDRIGQHTLEENIETGEYYQMFPDLDDNIPSLNVLSYIMSTTSELTLTNNVITVVDPRSNWWNI